MIGFLNEEGKMQAAVAIARAYQELTQPPPEPETFVDKHFAKIAFAVATLALVALAPLDLFRFHRKLYRAARDLCDQLLVDVMMLVVRTLLQLDAVTRHYSPLDENNSDAR